MRFASVAAALSLFVAVTASVGNSAPAAPDPRAVTLQQQGRTALAAGNVQGAIDAFEAALAVDPGYTPLLLDLAEAARRENLQGRAIAFYREALRREPDNLAAISGEGVAMVEKGAVEKARRNLARLQSLCGARCPETAALDAALARGPQPRMVAAESVLPQTQVTQN